MSSTSAPTRGAHRPCWSGRRREANIEGVGEIAQRRLVRHALRLNPRWLIVGEVRDGDAAREMLLAMQHGHPSLSTVHHHSALSAWKKLAQYVAQGSEAVEFSIAALLISDAVDLFVHLGRDRRGPARRDGDLRGRRVERHGGPAQPLVRTGTRRPWAPAAAPDRRAPEQAAPTRLRRPPPPEPRRMVGVSC